MRSSAGRVRRLAGRCEDIVGGCFCGVVGASLLYVRRS